MLRKPPRPATRKDRPVSLPPVFRGAKLEEMPASVGSAAPPRSQSIDEPPDLSHPNKENRPFERREGVVSTRPLVGTSGSVDSGLETDVSLCQKYYIHFKILYIHLARFNKTYLIHWQNPPNTLWSPSPPLVAI